MQDIEVQWINKEPEGQDEIKKAVLEEYLKYYEE